MMIKGNQLQDEEQYHICSQHTLSHIDIGEHKCSGSDDQHQFISIQHQFGKPVVHGMMS